MLEIGSLVDGKYKILSQVGHGGMSVVYMAINEKANKTWAVKEVRKDGVLDFEAVKQGLVAETDILKKLNHPNLPSIIDVIDTEDSFIIIMDYIQGNSLNEALNEYGAQPQEMVIEWAKQLCDVLGYLHSRQPPIIYRDMKPSNVMLKPDGNVTLIDFGTAREFKEKNLADTTCLGTVGYAAPEQFGGMGQTDARTDIYCLGATLYHLVTGQNPCEPPYEIRPIREINPALSSGLERIILKCTQRNPADRYQSAAELMYALEHYEEIDDIYRKKQKRKLGAFIAAAGLSVALLISGITLNRVAAGKATELYRQNMNRAETESYEKKVELYKECVEITGQGGVKDAYLALIKAYKEDDGVLSAEEGETLRTLISNHKEELQADPAVYTEICFEAGKSFWYYYNYGSGNPMTRATSAINWFSEVVKYAPDDYENKGMATVYSNIGAFYRDIATDIAEANDRGKYAPLYDNFKELISTVAKDENEADIVRLELLELSVSAVQQYATKFKADGVSEENLISLIEEIKSISDSIIETDNTSVTYKKKQNIEIQSESAKAAVQTAFNTNKGGA